MNHIDGSMDFYLCPKTTENNQMLFVAREPLSVPLPLQMMQQIATAYVHGNAKPKKGHPTEGPGSFWFVWGVGTSQKTRLLQSAPEKSNKFDAQ